MKKRYGIYVKRHNGSSKRSWYETPEERETHYWNYKGMAKDVGKGRMIFYVKRIQRS